jgi:hypothetical protein
MRACAVCRAEWNPDYDFCLPCFVREGCERCGVPEKVTDLAVIRQVVALLGGPITPASARGRPTGGRARPRGVRR